MLTSEFLSDSISFRSCQPIGHFILTFFMFPASLGYPPHFNFFPSSIVFNCVVKICTGDRANVNVDLVCCTWLNIWIT